MTITIEALHDIKQEDFQFLGDELHDFNRSILPDLKKNKPFRFILKKGKNRIGGITGTLTMGSLMIEWFWIDEQYRRQGYGKDLLAAAERFALEHEGHIVALNTINPNAVAFYLSQGYAITDSIPLQQNQQITYMKKRIKK